MNKIKSNWQDIRIPNHASQKMMLGSDIDVEVYERFQKASKKFGWGGKRRLLEAAIVKILDETDFE
jgi:hypothetical protein